MSDLGARVLCRQLRSPKLHTAGSYRCAGPEGCVFPEWSAKGGASSHSLGKLVEVPGRQPPASTFVRQHENASAPSAISRGVAVTVAADCVANRRNCSRRPDL